MKIHLKWLRIEANSLKKVEDKARSEGKIEGRQEGIQIGEKKGIKIREEKGKLEGKLEIAQSMLKKGYSIEDIILLTGLSGSQIEHLM